MKLSSNRASSTVANATASDICVDKEALGRQIDPLVGTLFSAHVRYTLRALSVKTNPAVGIVRKLGLRVLSYCRKDDGCLNASLNKNNHTSASCILGLAIDQHRE
jgi:hypothetical protein